ncbi:MAG: Uma2 family endonuclease [Bryobacteraceae bacterium]
MRAQPSTFLTPEEYLEIERRAEWKSEYFQGEMIEMPQVNLRHALIVTNAMCELSQQLEERPCGVYASNLRLQVAATGFYTYPARCPHCVSTSWSHRMRRASNNEFASRTITGCALRPAAGTQIFSSHR